MASPGLYTTPIDLTLGRISLISSTCCSTGDKSDKPVTFLPGCSSCFTNLAPTGSVTAVNTIGMVFVAETSAWAVGVAIPTKTSGFSPTN
ncbi:Uncharacterised protein [Vibrio cholerae]|nr:Uncharacterised protein [Vibrio cholerae]